MPPACCLPTIPAWKWRRWAARPACIRRASAARMPPTKPTTACCSKNCAAWPTASRFSGPHATDETNNRLLLEKLRGVANRQARFVCKIALVEGARLVRVYHGAVEGAILDEPRGSGGFGYDPLFYCPAFGCTFGEATGEQKFSLSHRGQAVRAMMASLDC